MRRARQGLTYEEGDMHKRVAEEATGPGSRRRRGRIGWSVSCRTGAIAIVLAALIAALGPSPAQGESTMPTGRTSKTDYAIGPQPLNTALRDFALASGLQVSFNDDLAQGLISPGVRGSFTPEEALTGLLAGTGLSFRFTSADTVTLERGAIAPPAPAATPRGQGPPAPNAETPRAQVGERPVKVPEIVVKGVKERDDAKTYVPEDASTATRTPTPIRDIPQSIEVVTRKVMDDQKVIRLDDALKNVSGITNSNLGFGNTRDAYQCRGFTCGIFKNNLRFDTSSQYLTFIESANLARIEVLKGPPSVLYGRSEPGGIINLLTKQPLLVPYYSTDTIFGSYGLYRPTIDLSGPINNDKTALYRFNGAYENAESFRDLVRSQRWFAAPVFTWALGHDTTLTLEGEYLRDRRTNDRGVPAIGTGPAPVPVNRFLGESFAMVESEEGHAGAQLTHRFNKDWSLFSAFRADLGNASNFDFFYPVGVQADGRTLPRQIWPVAFDISSYYLRNDAVGGLKTGPIDHTILVGSEVGRQHSRFRQGMINYTPIDIFDPVYTNFKPDIPLTRLLRTSRLDAVGLYVQDQLTIFEDFKVLAGVRYDYLRQVQDTSGVSSSNIK